MDETKKAIKLTKSDKDKIVGFVVKEESQGHDKRRWENYERVKDDKAKVEKIECLKEQLKIN